MIELLRAKLRQDPDVIGCVAVNNGRAAIYYVGYKAEGSWPTLENISTLEDLLAMYTDVHVVSEGVFERIQREVEQT